MELSLYDGTKEQMTLRFDERTLKLVNHQRSQLLLSLYALVDDADCVRTIYELVVKDSRTNNFDINLDTYDATYLCNLNKLMVGAYLIWESNDDYDGVSCIFIHRRTDKSIWWSSHPQRSDVMERRKLKTDIECGDDGLEFFNIDRKNDFHAQRIRKILY